MPHLPPHLPRSLSVIKKFPCTGCGACCRMIHLSDDIVEREDTTHPHYFPYTHKEGICENLEDNKCKIYDTRPLICRIDDLCDYFGYDREIYHRENIKACGRLIDFLGMDEKWKPTLVGLRDKS